MSSNKSRTRNTQVVILTVLIAFLMCVPISATGRLLDKFEGDQLSVTVDFLTAGIVDRAAIIPWNYTATTLHATMNVSAAPHTNGGTDYPQDPSINVGGLGAPEWAYTGQGYGAYGFQSTFIDDSSSYRKELIDSGKVVPPSVILPSDAQISSASLRLKGDTANVNYSDNFNGYNGVNKVAYSQKYNTVFLGGNYWGVIARNLDDGTYRRFSPDSYPSIPDWSINALEFNDDAELLFVGTNNGLQIIAFKEMEPVEVISRTSDLNTLTNNIYSVSYDSQTGLLIIGESGDIAIFNYSSRTKLGYVDIGSGIIVNDVELDLTNNRIWAATNWGVFGVNMTDLLVKNRYTQTSNPSIPGYYAQDLTYDAANDRLIVGSRTTWNPYPGGVTIINVNAGTKFAEITNAGPVALPSRAVWSVTFGKDTNTIYVGTEGGVGAYSLSPLSQIKRYTTVSTPSTLSTYNLDISYNKNMDYLVVATWLGVSVLNIGTASKVLDFTKLTENPSFPGGSITDVLVDQSLGIAMVSQYYGVVSLVNLSTNKIEINLTNAEFMNGHACGAITKVIYSQERHWLITACSSGAGPNTHNAIGIYNVSSRKFTNYYDDTTAPALLLTQWPGWYGYIYGMAYDSFRNVIVLGQYYGGVLVLNMTSNTTYAITGATANPMRVQALWGVYDVAIDLAKSLVILCDYGFGVSIFNISSNNRYDIHGTTNPSIYIYMSRVEIDPVKNYLYAGGYNGLDVFNITNPVSIKLVARYNTGTNPYLPASWYNHMHLDSSANMVYIAANGGAYGLDLISNTTTKRYTTTTSLVLFQANALGFTNYMTEGWDLIATANALQIIKHDPCPMDPEVWLGGQLIWRKSGLFNTTATISGIGAKVQSALAKAGKADADTFGIVMAALKLKIVTQRAGTLTMDEIAIEYEHTSKTPDLSQAINDYIASVGPSWDRNVPLSVSSGSAGKISLDKLNIEIDEAPRFTKFPSDLWIYENSFQGRLVDINLYVNDDFDLKTDLKYTAKALTNSTRVDVGIFEGHYVYLDAQSKIDSVNWTGTVQLVVTATDTRGLTRTADPFIVKVEPVKAVVIISTPVTVVMEDADYEYDVDAVSHRELALTYSLDKAPTGMQIDPATGLINWTPVNDDVGNHEITVNVTDGNDSAFQTYSLSVLNVQDPPVISPIPDITCYESVNFILDMSKYVKDVDDPQSNLSVVARSSYATINGLQVLFKYPLNGGITSENVTLTVSDGKALASRIVKIKVLGAFKVGPVPDQSATEGTGLTVDMATYIKDPQAKKLTLTASGAFLKVNGTRIEFLFPVGSKMTEQNVTVKISDGTPVNDTTVKFKVTVSPVFPTAAISSPTSGSKVSGKVTVSGSSAISSGAVTKVMVKIDNGVWVQASGTNSWSYELKTKDLKLKDGVHYIHVQSWSNNVSSKEVMVDFVVKNPVAPRVSNESYLGLGLIIGLIIAIVIAVIAYSIGKKKRGEPDEPAPRRSSSRPIRDMPDEDGPSMQQAPVTSSRPSRHSRASPSPVKAEPRPRHDAVIEPGPPQMTAENELLSEEASSEASGAAAAATTLEEDKSMDLSPTVEESFAPVNYEPEPTAEPSQDEPLPEDKPQPGPPSEDESPKEKDDESKDSADIALSEILAKLGK